MLSNASQPLVEPRISSSIPVKTKLYLRNVWGKFTVWYAPFEGGYMWWFADGDSRDEIIREECVADIDGMRVVAFSQLKGFYRSPRVLVK